MNKKETKSSRNIYIAVFAVVVVIIAAAALSTLFFNNVGMQSQSGSTNVTLQNYGPAPQLSGIAGWINSKPLNISQLRGNVILIDFWTYSCINCIRAEPHVEAWYKAYGQNGLVVIGVSTPEFQFEHNYTNVLNATQRFGITYPVALDNNYSTWDAYDNHYWPADYIIDAQGNIRYETFGEGDYNQTEEAIRELLLASGHTIQPNLTSVPLGVNFSGIGTPEIYLGWQRARQPLGNPQGFVPNTTVDYVLSQINQSNVVYLSGEWYNAPDGMVAVNNSIIYLIYKAKSVNVVAGAAVNGTTTEIAVGLNGTALNRSTLGSSDVLANGQAVATIGPNKLYNIVNATGYGVHVLQIDASPGFKIYTFTFG